MKRALIITVGTGRNGKDIAESIHFSIRRNPHDVLCFIVSKLTREQTLPHILKLLNKSENDEGIGVVEIDEVNDVEVLIEEYKKLIDWYIQNGIKAENISVDYTSGTKAMSVALVYAAINKEIDTLSYIYGRRDETGTVIRGTERINPLRPNAIFTSKKINSFKAFFNKYQFESALEILQNGPIHFDYQKQVKIFQTLAMGYSAWDKFDFEKALNELNSIDSNDLSEMRLKGKIANHKQLLFTLKQSALSEAKAKDLYFNALRRAEEGKFDDGVARLYRVIEMIAQMEFEVVYDCETGKVPKGKLSKDLHKEFSHVFDEEKQIFILGLMNSFKALKEKDSEIAEKFFDNINDFKKILGARNNSILAHGSTPVTAKTFDKFKNIIDLIYPIGMAFNFPKLD